MTDAVAREKQRAQDAKHKEKPHQVVADVPTPNTADLASVPASGVARNAADRSRSCDDDRGAGADPRSLACHALQPQIASQPITGNPAPAPPTAAPDTVSVYHSSTSATTTHDSAEHRSANPKKQTLSATKGPLMETATPPQTAPNTRERRQGECVNLGYSNPNSSHVFNSRNILTDLYKKELVDIKLAVTGL